MSIAFFGFTVLNILMSPNVSEGNYIDACYSILLQSLPRIKKGNTIDFGDKQETHTSAIPEQKSSAAAPLTIH